jgi:rhodanese-related sulfurtransferase/polyisoprenoid-binding protein YceI
MSFFTIDESTLRAWLDEGRDFTLLDVLPEEAYAEMHLPGANSACVYEMAFLDKVRETVPDPGGTVVVYCSGPGCLASLDAANRLDAAGYRDVHRYEGGREDWQARGHPLEGSRANEAWRARDTRPIEDGEHAVDTEKSVLEWVGRNVANAHDGTLRLSGGSLTTRAGALVGGVLEIDMSSVEVGDLEGEMARLLKVHLESEDFFAVERFPRARIEVTEARSIADAPPGSPNCEISGRLTLRGESAEIMGPAVVAPHGKTGLALQANIEVDRTLWGVNYGSGKLYHRLGMHLVNDAIGVRVRVLTRE